MNVFFNSNYVIKLRKISIQALLQIYLTSNFTAPRTFVSRFLCLGKLHELNSYELLTLDGIPVFLPRPKSRRRFVTSFIANGFRGTIKSQTVTLSAG